jgi:hypothetical protein
MSTVALASPVVGVVPAYIERADLSRTAWLRVSAHPVPTVVVHVGLDAAQKAAALVDALGVDRSRARQLAATAKWPHVCDECRIVVADLSRAAWVSHRAAGVPAALVHDGLNRRQTAAALVDALGLAPARAGELAAALTAVDGCDACGKRPAAVTATVSGVDFALCLPCRADYEAAAAPTTGRLRQTLAAPPAPEPRPASGASSGVVR